MAVIGLLGDLDLSFVTHRELDAATRILPSDIEVVWIPTDDADSVEQAARVDGLWAIPGTPYRNDDAVYRAIETARTTGQPFLGTCGGFQYAAVEYARNVAGLEAAAHGEVDPSSEFTVIEALSCSLVAQERKVSVLEGTRLSEILGTEPFMGYHYCNFGLSEDYLEELVEHGLTVSARAPDAGVEAFEIDSDGFFIATLFQPQVGSVAGNPLNPLITAFCEAATERSRR